MPAKRVLLMYISEVSGHRNAARAVEKALKILAPDTEVMSINAFSYTNPISEKIVNRIYMGIIKVTPQIWDFLYDNPGVAKNVAKIKESIHKSNSPKLKVLFDKFKPDVVACTQAFPCGMVADFKKNCNSDLPLVAVLTDYIPHSYWVYDKVDYYIVPSEEVAGRLIKKGVSPEKVKPFGIPFDHEFNRQIFRQEVFDKLGFSLDVFTVLIMGGGQGLGPIKTIVKSLEKIKLPLQEIIVSGTNKKLYNSLKKKIKKSKHKIALFGYSDKISEFMSASDIVVTKPGGITTAEALSKKLPMIIIKPIPGQEANNTAYLTKRKAAIKLTNVKKIDLIISDLIVNRAKLKKLSESAAIISKPDASMDAARLLLNLR